MEAENADPETTEVPQIQVDLVQDLDLHAKTT